MAHFRLSIVTRKESVVEGKADIPRNVINCTAAWVWMGQGGGHRTGIAFSRRIEAMTRQHHTSFAQSIFGSAQRLFRSNGTAEILAPTHIDAPTARDIGVNLIGIR